MRDCGPAPARRAAKQDKSNIGGRLATVKRVKLFLTTTGSPPKCQRSSTDATGNTMVETYLYASPNGADSLRRVKSAGPVRAAWHDAASTLLAPCGRNARNELIEPRLRDRAVKPVAANGKTFVMGQFAKDEGMEEEEPSPPPSPTAKNAEAFCFCGRGRQKKTLTSGPFPKGEGGYDIPHSPFRILNSDLRVAHASRDSAFRFDLAHRR